jgi:hypothetical protein
MGSQQLRHAAANLGRGDNRRLAHGFISPRLPILLAAEDVGLREGPPASQQ